MSQYIPFLNYNTRDILTLFGEPSLSAFYMVFLPVGQVGSGLANAFEEADLYNTSIDGYRLEEKMSLLCSDATLPGSTFNTVEVRGNRQGIIERVAQYKIFPNVDFSFMVDSGHSVIRLFETWMGFISPLNGDVDSPTSYYKFRYPDEYVLDFYIVKFEKNESAFDAEKSEEGGVAFQQSTKTVYKFKRAYPTNMASIPLSYEGSSLIKSGITFQYDRYYTFDIAKNNTPTFIKEFVDNIVRGND